MSGTYCSSPHPSCPRSRCHSRTASAPARSGCSCSGTGRAHRCVHLGGTGTGISITHVHKREQACLLAGQAALLAAGQLHQKPPSDPASPTQFRKTNRSNVPNTQGNQEWEDTRHPKGWSPRPLLTAFLLRLIGPIPAVILSVTLPARWDAPARVLAPEFIHTTSHLCWGQKQDDTHMGRGDGIGTAQSHLLPKRLVPAARSCAQHPCMVQTGQDATRSCSPPRGTSRWDRSRQSHITRCPQHLQLCWD